MNMSGVIKGGLVAGLVLNVGEIILNLLLVADQWEEVASRVGYVESPTTMVYYVVGGFVIGILAVWLYAAVRPRLGPGPGTAIKVGLAIWFLGWLWPWVPLVLGGVFPPGLMIVSWIWSVVEVPLAVTAGAWLYKEAGREEEAAAPA